MDSQTIFFNGKTRTTAFLKNLGYLEDCVNKINLICGIPCLKELPTKIQVCRERQRWISFSVLSGSVLIMNVVLNSAEIVSAKTETAMCISNAGNIALIL